MNTARDADIIEVLSHLEQLMGDRQKLSGLTRNEVVDIYDRLSRLSGVLFRLALAEPVSEAKLITPATIESEQKEETKEVETAATVRFDLRKQVSTLDYFRFRRELFQDNDMLIREVSMELNALPSVVDATTYLHQRMRWKEDDPTVSDFAEVVSEFFRRRG